MAIQASLGKKAISISKTTGAKKGWRLSSSGQTPALQVQSLEFKLQFWGWEITLIKSVCYIFLLLTMFFTVGLSL
jgi:hypothetical protein